MAMSKAFIVAINKIESRIVESGLPILFGIPARIAPPEKILYTEREALHDAGFKYDDELEMWLLDAKKIYDPA